MWNHSKIQGAMTFSIMTFCIMIIQNNDIQHKNIQHNRIQHYDIQDNVIQHIDIQHNGIQHKGLFYDIQHYYTHHTTLCIESHYAWHHYAECHVSFSVMLICPSVVCYYSGFSYPECQYSECSGTKFKVADTLCGIFAKCNIFCADISSQV
jgi:hypothetical protein